MEFDIENALRKYLPLEGTEQAFRYIYEQGIPFSEVDATSPQIMECLQKHDVFADMGGFWEIVHSMQDSAALPNTSFFRPEQNIAIMRHPRYMPEILHTHQNFFEIQCVLSGEIRQSIGGVPIVLHGGDFCFVAPNALHSPSVADDNTIMVNILIRVETLRTIISRSYSNEKDIITDFCIRILYGKTVQPMLVWRTEVDSKPIRVVLDMMEQFEVDSPLTDKLLCSMMEILFIYLLRDHKDNFTVGKPLRKNDTSVLNIMRYAQNNYATISLSALAKHFNYSETYLSHLIKSYYGRTFQEMMMEYRLQNAAKLLSQTNATITEILDTIGYSEKSHFFRAFKKLYGVTPQTYRRTNQPSTATVGINIQGALKSDRNEEPTCPSEDYSVSGE